MCNLYDIGRSRHQSRDEWEKAVAEVVRDLEKPFGIRKTDPGVVAILRNGEPIAETMRWGFERPYNSAVNNARSEKLDGTWSKPWREKRRCLIPVSTFYEWSGPKGQKQTFAFEHRDDTTGLWVAGIWEEGKEGLAYSMLTRAANEQIESIHDRMPALLSPEQFSEFLDSENPVELLSEWDEPLSITRVENPLKHPDTHDGPVPIDFLPGLDG